MGTCSLCEQRWHWCALCLRIGASSAQWMSTVHAGDFPICKCEIHLRAFAGVSVVTFEFCGSDARIVESFVWVLNAQLAQSHTKKGLKVGQLRAMCLCLHDCWKRSDCPHLYCRCARRVFVWTMPHNVERSIEMYVVVFPALPFGRWKRSTCNHVRCT